MLPDKDHPLWKLAQSVVTLVGLIVLVTHGFDGAHAGGVDVADATGAGSLALGGKLLYQWMQS